MHGLVSDSSQALYGRSDLVLNIRPMLYRDFCDALELNPHQIKTILLFTLTGGLPRYWKFLDRLKTTDPIQAAEALYFEPGSPLEDEPDRILKDEGSIGQMARSILECIGRGSYKLTEIAGRLNQPSTNLSRALRMLLDLNLIQKDHPFGASERESKLSIYRLADPVLQFWFHVYSPQRSKWMRLTPREKMELLHNHAGMILEQMIRELWPDSRRFWGKDLEWDSVREISKSKLLVSEVKFGSLSDKDRSRIVKTIEEQFNTSLLAKKYELERVDVIDIHDALTLLSKKAR